MDILSIIEKKRTKQELSKAEIFFFIDQLVTKKTINDYQASALIMAININGMSENETFYLTDAMLKSGETIDFKGIPGIIIDKHSTGGVGDKISLILSPICVALGIKIAKISGRGLGHTGGTIDKLDSISVNCDLSQNQYMKLLKHDSMFIMSQTDQLTPADKIIYALRNATSTVNSIPLITSSIVCKKMALKTDFVFLDVKVGDGGFCKTLDDALKLSHALLSTFKKYQRPTIIHITNMTQPLGRAIGNAIEVKAAIDFLKGFPESNEVKKLIYDFVADILLTVGKVKKRSDAIHQIDDVVKNGTALQIFKR
jgi:pyrimidine-nucleoside phosphorylase